MKSEPGTTRQQCAYEGGERAKRKGLTLKDNPHKTTDKVSREWWQKGWEAALQEDRP